MKEKIKKLVRDQLKNKRIVLFGAGVVAEEFYKKYKGVFNISHCVSNVEEEWGESVFCDSLDVRKFRRDEIKKDDYIVVCGPIAFRTIEVQLEAESLYMFKDYVESTIAEAIWANKKIALFYGQCVLRDIRECIVQVPEYVEQYATIFTQAGVNQPTVINRVLYYAKDLCDLYVYTPKILDRDSMFFLTAQELPADCKIVSISNLAFSVYWPQIDMRLDHYNEVYIHPYMIKRDLDFYHTIYRKADLNINRMVSEGLSYHEISRQLNDPDFYQKKQIIRNRDIAMKMIDIAEKDVTVNIGDYIRANYQNVELYQNYTHPNREILWEYIRRFLNVIGISSKHLEQLEANAPKHTHQGGDVPIYPGVAKKLELEFVDEYKKYEILTGNGVVYMTFQEYVNYYVEYTCKAFEIMRMW